MLTGKLTLERETEIIAATKVWLEERADNSKGYATYLKHWDEWVNPWTVRQDTEDDNKSAESPSPAEAANTSSTPSSSNEAQKTEPIEGSVESFQTTG